MYDIARESAYPTPLANSAFLPLVLMTLASQKISPSNIQTPCSIKEEYDFIVVGAGSAGAVVATRLSELSHVNVLLLEAGGEPPLLSDVPSYGPYFLGTDLDWAYKTTPQKHSGANLKNSQLIWPGGKGLGGTSLINGEIVTRGNKKNYNDWAAQGATGWSYNEVLPYFKKLENETNPRYLANGYHGTKGPNTVETPKFNLKLKSKYIKGVKELGYEIVDPNGPRQTGFYVVQGNIREGQRCSSAKAYLVPAENRTNLHILTNAFVHKVNIEEGKAVGVTFDVNGAIHKVKANKEVIMSAGTINSAQLLMLSGIGPKEELKKHGIPLNADLPVGKNLQDHATAPTVFGVDQSIDSFSELLGSNDSFNQFINDKSGPLTSMDTTILSAYLNGDPKQQKLDIPSYELDIEPLDLNFLKIIGITDEAYKQAYSQHEDKKVYFCLPSVVVPKSRGTVKLQSSDPHKAPLIDPNYYAETEDLDVIVDGIKMCHRLSATKAMQSIGSTYLNTVYPGCEKCKLLSDDYFRCFAKSVLSTLSHQVGTAKMGDPNDPTTVVDPELKVKGIKGLRVVDASVMPIIPSASTNFPTIMVAEKASDIIKKSIKC